MRKIFFKLIILSLLGSQNIYAQTQRGNDSGGGDAIVKRNVAYLLDLVERGYFHFSPLSDKKVRMIYEKIEPIRREKLPLSNRASGIDMLPAVSSLTWILVDGPLPDIKDEGFVSYEYGDGDRKKQLGVQKGSVVWVDQNIYRKMPPMHRSAFAHHEQFVAYAIAARLDLNTSLGTAPIRESVNMLYSNEPNVIPARRFQQIFFQLPLLKEFAKEIPVGETKNSDGTSTIVLSHYPRSSIIKNPRYRTQSRDVAFGFDPGVTDTKGESWTYFIARQLTSTCRNLEGFVTWTPPDKIAWWAPSFELLNKYIRLSNSEGRPCMMYNNSLSPEPVIHESCPGAVIEELMGCTADYQ